MKMSTTMSKPLKTNSYYSGMQGGEAPDIAMPDYNETAPIANAVQDPWQAHPQVAQPENPFGAVPEELPQDVRKAMQPQEEAEPEQESVDQEPTEEEVVQDEQPVQKAQKGAKTAQESFRDVRAAKERAERERDILMSQMLEMQQRMQQAQPVQKPEPVEEMPDVDLDIDADSLVEGKHVKKLATAYKAMQKQMKEYQAQTQALSIETRIKAQYPDYDAVVSRENVEMLNEQFPEIARTLRDTPDLYNKAAAAYSVIKNFGIHKPAAPAYAPEKAKAIANAAKPRPLASVAPQQGDSPLSKANAFANGMTAELKEQLRKEMYAARKSM
jgi:hypothetical protein